MDLTVIDLFNGWTHEMHCFSVQFWLYYLKFDAFNECLEPRQKHQCCKLLLLKKIEPLLKYKKKKTEKGRAQKQKLNF